MCITPILGQVLSKVPWNRAIRNALPISLDLFEAQRPQHTLAYLLDGVVTIAYAITKRLSHLMTDTSSGRLRPRHHLIGGGAALRALIIDEPWISKILEGRKTWELRKRNMSIRERISLIRPDLDHGSQPHFMLPLVRQRADQLGQASSLRT